MKIYESAVRKPISTILLFVGVMVFGLFSLMNLAVDQYPEIEIPQISVITMYPGANAADIETNITRVLEDNLNTVSNLKKLTSKSQDNVSMITVEFEYGSDLNEGANEIRDVVSRVQSQLPDDIDYPTIFKFSTSMIPVMMLAVTAEESYPALNKILDDKLVNVLNRVDGVGAVSIIGAPEREVQVNVDPAKLEAYNLTVEQLGQIIAAENVNIPSGTIDVGNNTFNIKADGEFKLSDEMRKVVVSNAGGRTVRLSDVAQIRDTLEKATMDERVNGQRGVRVMFQKQSGANTVNIVHEIQSRLPEIQKTLPKDVKMELIFEGSQEITDAIGSLSETILYAFIFVVLVVMAFLGRWRATLIICMTIPVSLICSFIYLFATGSTLNIISLSSLSIAIGMVVDDAIVVVEAAQVNIAAGMRPRAAALEAMKNVASPIVATTVVLLAVFVPVSFTGGITGRLFQQFSITIAVSVVISAFNALTLSPALCALLLRRREPPQKGFFAAFNRWFSRNMDRYTAFTPTLIRHVTRTGVFIAVVLAVIFVVWRKLPAGFLPEEDQGYVMVMVSTPEASALPVTQAAMEEADAVIRTLPEVASTSFAAGFNMMAGIASTDSGIIFVSLVDFADRKLSAMEIAQKLTDELYVAVPGAECYAFIPPSIPGLGITSGVSVEVQDLEGRGTAYLLAQAGRLMDSLRKQPSIASVTTQFNAGVPQRRLRIDKEQALAAGVDLGVLYGDLTTLLGGAYINNFSRFGKLYQTYIQAAPEYRLDKRSLDNYYVASSSGESVPVSSFVEVVDTVGVEYVSQFNLYRSISLTVTPAARASTTTVMQEITRTAGEVLPDDIGTAWSGTSYQEANASKTGGLVYLLALVFVFLALAALYESWGLPLAILMSVPVAVLGAVLFIGGSHLLDAFFVNDVYMQISLVMLIGLAAKNAILVVEYADRLFNEKGLSLMDAAIGAAKLRVRPIIMTAFAFILGVMPLVFASGVYATARNIMGVALVGGMLFATLLGIFVYPALYYFVGRIGNFERRRERKKQEEKL